MKTHKGVRNDRKKSHEYLFKKIHYIQRFSQTNAWNAFINIFQSNLFIHSITTDIIMLLHCNNEAVNEHIDVNDIHKSFNKQSI